MSNYEYNRDLLRRNLDGKLSTDKMLKMWRIPSFPVKSKRKPVAVC